MSGRVFELERCLSLLSALGDELRFTLAPVEEILARLGARREFDALPLAKWCCRLCREGRRFGPALAQSLESAPGALAQDDLLILSPLCQVLGCTDLESQLAALELCATLLAARLTEARRIQESRSRLYVSMGALAGMALGVVLF